MNGLLAWLNITRYPHTLNIRRKRIFCKHTLDNSKPLMLLSPISRYYKFLPGEQQQAFLENLRQKAS